MWKEFKKQKPKLDGCYIVSGKVGSIKVRTNAYWENGIWVDKDGDDFNGLGKMIRFWFDFSCVHDPLD